MSLTRVQIDFLTNTPRVNTPTALPPTAPFEASNWLYVRKGINASDSNDGTDPSRPLLTLNAASIKAMPGTLVDIGPGKYQEILPLRWRRNIQVRGSGIRITRVGGAPGYEFTDIFKVDGGFKCNELTFENHQADEARQAWAVSFNELADNRALGAVSDGAWIDTSPYIQNCTSYTAEDDAGLAGSLSTGTTGGGMLVDGDMCAINSPIRSMVVDSFTQVNLAGPGCLVRNDGYAQLVSFFGTFCTYHVRAESGGQWNLSGGGTSDFGLSALQADGYSPRPLYTAKSRGDVYGALRLEENVTFNIPNNLILIANPDLIEIGDRLRFRANSGTLPGLSGLQDYTVIASGFTGGAFRVSPSGINGAPAVLGGGTPGGFSLLREGATTIDVIEVSANRLGGQLKFPTAGSLGSTEQPVQIFAISGTPPDISFSVQLGTIAGIKHEYVAGGTVSRGGTSFPITSCNYNNETGTATISATGFTPAVGQIISLAGLSFICDSSSRPGPGFMMFPQLVFPSAGPTDFTYTRIDSRNFTYTAPAAPDGPTHDYASGGAAVIGGIDRLVKGCTYDHITGLVRVTTKNDLPATATGTVTMSGLRFICKESRYIVQAAIPIDAAGESVDNLSPNKIGYRVTFFSDTNLGLRHPLTAGQVLDFRRRSQGSAPSHTMEYVGSGTNYSALPDSGGVPNPGNRIIETNGGRIFYTSVDELGNYVIGGVFGVDATTGVVTTTARGFIITNILGIGPFSRNGGFSTVGVQLLEVSNNPNLIASTGAPDGNTAPTQSAVVNYVGPRFVSNVDVAPSNALRVTGLPQQDGAGNWSFVKTLSIAGTFSASGLSMSTLRVLGRTAAGSGAAQELPITAAQATYWGNPTAANHRAAMIGTTGTGPAVFADDANLNNPVLNTPASGNLINCLGLPIATGVAGLAIGAAAFLATPSPTNLFNLLTGKTGTGLPVFADNANLNNPVLNTPASGNLINCVGLPVATGISGLAAGAATFLGAPTNVNLRALISNGTSGTGVLLFGTNPTMSGATFTGSSNTAPTAAVDTNTTQLANTAFVIGQGYLKSADAASTYLTLTLAASTYQTQSSAAATYLTQSNAAATYLTQSAAASGYQPLDADLSAIAALATAAAGRDLLIQTSIPNIRTYLGLGTFATQNFVSPPAIGATTPNTGRFSSFGCDVQLRLPSAVPTGPVAGHLYRINDTLRYLDGSVNERTLLNATDNLANLSNNATARSNLGLATSDGLAEGSTNLYFTNARARAAGVAFPADVPATAIPAAGTNLKIFATTIAGRNLLHGIGPSGRTYSYQPALRGSLVTSMTPFTGAAFSSYGGSWSSSGTITTADAGIVGASAVFPLRTNFATAASANATAGAWTAALPIRHSKLSSTLLGGFDIEARIGLPNASYASSGASTGSRLFVGVTSGSTGMVSSSSPTGDFAGFHFVDDGSNIDTQFQFATRDGTTTTRTSTGMTFSPECVYDCYVYSRSDDATRIYWRIDNRTLGTTAEGSVTATLPRTDVFMRPVKLLGTVNAVARSIAIAHGYLEADF